MNPSVSRVAYLGKVALKIYTCHLLVFTIGCVVGSIETFSIIISMGWKP